MYNWSVDEKAFQKADPKGYQLWQLTQTINYGEAGEKLDQKTIRKHWSKIEGELDPYKKRFLEFLLWKKLYSLPDNLTFWNWPARVKK